MTVKELHGLFNQFIENEFGHLRDKVDKLLYLQIALLGGVIASIAILLFK